MASELSTAERILNVADPDSEKAKFFWAKHALSAGFKESCSALINETSIATMSQIRLLLEGVARKIFKHPNESWDAYRIRVDHAEEWHYLGGSKKGLVKFLDYLGYDNYSFILIRNYNPSAWNEFELHINSTVNLAIDDLAYLVMVIGHLKSSIAVAHIFRSGIVYLPSADYLFTYSGLVAAVNRFYPNSYDCSGSYETYDRLLITPIEP